MVGGAPEIMLLEKGKMTIVLGGVVRTLQFKTTEVVLLEDRLKKDVLTFLGSQGSPNVFLREAIFAGLSRMEKRVSPTKVDSWLDEYEGEREPLMVNILYCIARALPGEDGKRLARVLDEYFPHHKGEGNPSQSALPQSTSATS